MLWSILRNPHAAVKLLRWCGSAVSTAAAKDYTKAMLWYKRAADKGNPEAMNNLSMMYAAGDGVPRNQEEAAKWFKMAEAAFAKR